MATSFMYRFKVTPVVSQTSSKTGTLIVSTVAARSDDDDDDVDGLAGENAETVTVDDDATRNAIAVTKYFILKCCTVGTACQQTRCYVIVVVVHKRPNTCS
jgi:hypothetical protein